MAKFFTAREKVMIALLGDRRLSSSAGEQNGGTDQQAARQVSGEQTDRLPSEGGAPTQAAAVSGAQNPRGPEGNLISGMKIVPPRDVRDRVSTVPHRPDAQENAAQARVADQQQAAEKLAAKQRVAEQEAELIN